MSKDESRAAKGEEAADHVAREVAGDVARVEGAAGEVGGLAELVAAREGEAVGDGQDEGDGYLFALVSSLLHPIP